MSSPRDGPVTSWFKPGHSVQRRSVSFRVAPAVELELAHQLPLAGSATSQLKVVSERSTLKGLELDFEALAHSTYDLPVRLNRPNVRIRGAEPTGDTLRLRFEGAAGYQRLSVSLTW